MKSSMGNEFVLPTLILSVICLIVSAALSVTYSITNPIIEENMKRESQMAIAEVLPGMDAYDEKITELPEGVLATYMAKNGAGIVCKVSSSGYDGPIIMMVGISAEKTITGIKILDNTETQGLGSKVMDASHTIQYVGKNSPDDVDGIAGASISSNALKDGIRKAMEAVILVKEGA